MKNPAVYMIGAGPGDPGLITVHGLECLALADVVVYDHDVPARLLKRARPDAELIDVGGETRQPLAHEAISLLIAENAREGKLVARLKLGDPFVFDRGGEEALFLHEQRIPFEIVPGVPLGIGVPAYAGVPVTYRGGGDTITLVRGYGDEHRAVPDIDWASLARLDGTVVCYAGAQQLARILESVLAKGWPAEEQGIVVYNGTSTSQHTVTGTLTALLAETRDHPRKDTAILILGRVVGFREHLRWFDARPLFGKRVLVTRPREQAAEMVDRLAKLGADTIEAPMIRIVPPEDPAPLAHAAASAEQFDWIVFTSGNAVEAFMEALLRERDLRALSGPQLCAVGSGTAERLARYGIKVDLVPDEFRAEAVLAALKATGSLDGLRVLIPRADIGRDVIVDGLRALGVHVTDVIAYRTVLDEALRDEGPDVYGMLLEGRIDVVTFTSPSAVRNFAAIYGTEQTVDLLAHTTVAAIGPVTADAATKLGLTVSVQPGTSSIAALVDAISAHVSRSQFASM